MSKIVNPDLAKKHSDLRTLLGGVEDWTNRAANPQSLLPPSPEPTSPNPVLAKYYAAHDADEVQDLLNGRNAMLDDAAALIADIKATPALVDPPAAP